MTSGTKAKSARDARRIEKYMQHAVLTNWLDPLLSGTEAVIQIGHLRTCPDVERLLLAVKARQDKAAMKLLQAERAALRRVVKQQEKNIKLRVVGFQRLDGYLMAITDVLNALERYRRGGQP